MCNVGLIVPNFKCKLQFHVNSPAFSKSRANHKKQRKSPPCVLTQGAGVLKMSDCLNQAFQTMSATVRPAGMNGSTCSL
jgi:hypothetical protein